MNLSRFALISAVSMVALAPMTGAEATNIVSSNFQVTIDSGILNGETYNGSFSYDLDETPQLEPLFEEFKTRPLTAFSLLQFEGVDYTDFSLGEANFDMVTDDFLGLTYNEPNVSFGFNTGFDFDVFDFVTTFVYNLSGDEGSGLLTLTTATTPEPSLLLGIGGRALGFYLVRRRIRNNFLTLTPNPSPRGEGSKKGRANYFRLPNKAPKPKTTTLPKTILGSGTVVGEPN